MLCTKSLEECKKGCDTSFQKCKSDCITLKSEPRKCIRKCKRGAEGKKECKKTCDASPKCPSDAAALPFIAPAGLAAASVAATPVAAAAVAVSTIPAPPIPAPPIAPTPVAAAALATSPVAPAAAVAAAWVLLLLVLLGAGAGVCCRWYWHRKRQAQSKIVAGMGALMEVGDTERVDTITARVSLLQEPSVAHIPSVLGHQPSLDWLNAAGSAPEPKPETEPKVSSVADDALVSAREHSGMSNPECAGCAGCAESAESAESERAFAERLASNMTSPASLRSGSTKSKRRGTM